MRLFLLAPLALAGCGMINPGADVDSLQLSETRLTLRFDDGVVCRTGLEASASPSGVFEGCPHPARYAIEYQGRNILGEALPDAVEPYARIAITHGAGRVTTFQTPESRQWTNAGWPHDKD